MPQKCKQFQQKVIIRLFLSMHCMVFDIRSYCIKGEGKKHLGAA